MQEREHVGQWRQADNETASWRQNHVIEAAVGGIQL
jgi:hypothetical protein